MKAIVVLFSLLFGSFAFADTENGACFYQDINYRGRSFCIRTPAFDNDLNTSFWGQQISSVAIFGRNVVEMHTKPGNVGATLTIHTSIPDLSKSTRGNWNDMAQSFKTYNVDGRVCLYELINYQGRGVCFQVKERIDNLYNYTFNDRAKSIRIDGWARAMAYEHAGYNGATFDIRHSVPDLRQYKGWYNVISSLEVFRN